MVVQMGNQLLELPIDFSNFGEILRFRANEQPKQNAYSFLLESEVEEAHLTYQELDCQARTIAALLQSCGVSGERALLLYPPGLEYIAAFFGCLYAGVVAVPAYPPRLNRPIPRLEAIVADAQATVVLTTTKILTQIEHQWLQTPNLKSMQWLATDNIPTGLEDSWQEIASTSDTLAFLQYTSGSTGTPKGVMVSHGNLLHNQRIIQQAMGHSSKTIFVGWLPLFHDMGLIGNMLQPMYLGIPCILMSPVAFLQRPLRWLQAISRYKATTSGGPNFAYDLCVSKITPEQRATLDLSSWEVAFNGAEPVRAQTLERFAATFASCGFRREAFYPCYGMAETTLIVSGGLKTASPILQPFQQIALAQNQVVPTVEDGVGEKTLVSCGQPLQDMQIVIAHPDTLTRCSSNEVGEIWVAGSSVAQGYWNQTEQTQQTFRAYLKDTGDGPFLRTGDLGFLYQGELFITGRLKDLIIIRGRNHYPQDIEKTAEQSHSALQSSSSAAFSVEVADEERLVLAIEVKRTYLKNLDVNEVIRAIRQAVVEEHELQVYAVLLLKTGSIPKTSSGKIQRHACRVGFLDRSLDVVGSSILSQSNSTVSSLTCEALLALEPEEQQQQLTSYLQELVAQVLKLAPSQLDYQQPLSTVGIDSLIAIELQNSIETKLGVVLPMANILEGSSIAELAIALLTQLTEPLHSPKITLAPEREVVTEYPLSYGQQALWFLHQLSPESHAYNIVNAVRLHGELDIAALQRAFQMLVERHPSLRTTFNASQGKATQHIHEHLEVCFQHENASTWSEEFLENRLITEAHRPFNLETGPLLRVNLFTRLANEHILLLAVHHIVADFWSLTILVDELGVIYQAQKAGKQHTLIPLTLQYTDYVRAWAEAMPAAGFPAERCANANASPAGERLWAYWHKQLSGELPVLNLPIDRPRPPVQTYQGASQLFKLNADLTQKLKALSKANSATLYMTLLAAFQVLLYRLSGQEDILVGSPTTGRSRADLAALVGYFVNPVVVRSHTSGNPSFEAFLKQVRSCVLDAFKHQDYPFARLVEQLQPVRDPSRSPLFQVMFVLQKTHLLNEEGLAAFALGETGARIKLGDLELESLNLSQRIAQFDLTLMMAEVDGALSASWQYNTDLFDTATIARMVKHFQTLLEGIVANPQQQVCTLPLLTKSEQHQLLMEWNTIQADYQNDFCLHQQFELQVARTPEAVAVVFEQERLTYRELNTKANQLAHYLQALGVKPEVLVGIYLERSVDMVVSILGILKAGGAYVPLDPTYPQERLGFILDDAQVWVLLTKEKLLAGLSEHQAQVVCLDKDGEILSQQRVDNPVSEVTTNNLAYVIYTSGSTGKPKGVLVNHQNVIRLFAATQSWFNFSDRDVWTNFHSYAFDFSVWEIWGALLYGGRLVVVPYWITRSPDAFYQLLCTEEVTILNQTPSAFRQLIHAEAASQTQTLALRTVIFGGEALELQSLQPWFERHGDSKPQLVNMYGITETTVHVTYRPITMADLSQKVGSPIGYRIPDLQVYLLDSQQQPVPIGVAGELYIGGAGVTRGYLNRPDLTAERFIINPFENQDLRRSNGKTNRKERKGHEGIRVSKGFCISPKNSKLNCLYKTGDLARFLANGELEYLGRIDQQVKIRGFRIELGEIEAVLCQHPTIQEAIALVLEPDHNQKPANPVNELGDSEAINGFRRLLKGKSLEIEAEGQLVVYYVCNHQPVPTVSELRRFLMEKLPDYMIPKAFVLMDAIPLTANGKVDRRSLPVPSKTRPELDNAFVAPRTSIEKILAEIWSNVLEIERVGIHDNFFEIGGDSIRSIQVRARATERGLNFSLPQLFQHQTIYTLAQEITTIEPGTPATTTKPFSLISEAERQKLPSDVVDAYPLARVQAGVIFHSQYCPDLPMYHDVFLYHLQVHLDVELFELALQQLVAYHPILRTSFDLTNFREPLQLVHQTVAVPFQVQDLRSLSPEQRKKALTDWIEVERNGHFDWSFPPIIRFFIQRLTDESFYFTLSCHNSILDGWSKSSLLTELLHRYYALLNGDRFIESLPVITYRDFIALERSVLNSPECRAFWTKKLVDCTTTKIKSWHCCDRQTDAPQIAVLDVPISPQVSEGLKKLSRLAQVPLKNVLLAAHIRVMSLLSGETDILTGLESNGRLEEADAEKTLGTHLNTVPFRFQLTGGTWVDLVQQVFEAERELLPFRRFPYADLQQLSGRQPLQPLVETVFNYTHFHIFHTLETLEGLGIVGAQGFGETHFGLKVEFNRNHASDGIQLDLECDLTNISQGQLEAIGRYFNETLTAMSSQPFERYESQCLLPESERHQILVEWNNTVREYPQDLLIHQQIEATAAKNPHAIALVFADEQLTYQELNHRANAVAHHLRSLGVSPDVPVAICIERSLEMIVGILGILKAGGAYLPLDPGYPQAHLAVILEDAQVPVLLTQTHLLTRLPAHKAEVVCLDSHRNTLSQECTDNLINHNTPENLAYIIYTSGSTGQPKGVLVTHQNLLHSTTARMSYYQEPVSSFLLLPSFAFDSSVGCLFWTLCQGGTLVLVQEGSQKDIWQLAKAIAQHQISHWLSVPSLYKALLAHIDPRELTSLSTVIVAGEICSSELVERHHQLLLSTSLFNEYGPTEGTVWSSVYDCQNHDITTPVAIGRPIANTQIYLLNSYGQPVPIGVPGELHIGGFGIAKGYLNRPELTAQKFIPNPFEKVGEQGSRGAGEAGEEFLTPNSSLLTPNSKLPTLRSRLYKTGDLGRYLPDGNIEFLGRRDYQVKLRGYRIELTEIEAVLLQHPVIREVVVIVREEDSGSKRLVAYIVPKQIPAPTKGELQSFLKQKLPEYMIPTAFLILDTLPGFLTKLEETGVKNCQNAYCTTISAV
ncbi:MAG: amino acid adenylation domain-containing protein [Desmonostoc geniculatum HA4340-LM1]|jgi:amino acid adenylation domain-containing protein|nr:amino acid adenylation domain-containing protein [Desmonostoc geniculatum HA4340-LM1]